MSTPERDATGYTHWAYFSDLASAEACGRELADRFGCLTAVDPPLDAGDADWLLRAARNVNTDTDWHSEIEEAVKRHGGEPDGGEFGWSPATGSPKEVAQMTTPDSDDAVGRLLKLPQYVGMYAPDGAELPRGYIEARDPDGHRIFLNEQELLDAGGTDQIQPEQLMGIPGTPAPDERFPTTGTNTGSDTPAPDLTDPQFADALARMFSEVAVDHNGLALGDVLSALLGADADGDRGTITLDATWFARILGHYASVQAEMERLAEHATELREQRDAVKLALSLVTEGDPLPPTDFHTHPWAMDMMASLKRARQEAADAAQDDISVRPAHLFSTKRHPAAPGLDGNEDPTGPGPQEA